MFQSTSQPASFYPQDSSFDRNRQQVPHSIPGSSLHASPFTVSGLASSTSTTHGHAPSPWGASTSPGGGLTSSLSDSFLHSRSSYQSGYLMSMSQNNASPQANQRFDDLPVVQTKAKLNSTLSSRGPTSEFGKDPMFESSRQRQTLDEDAPPTASVNDIVTATYAESAPGYFRADNLESSAFRSSLPRPSPPSASAHTMAVEPAYVIVFGYPPDKYSVAVDYFKQFGETTEPDPNTEIVNCFRIGFKQPGDALWAIRKNGEIINGSWMVGVKWADAAQAEHILRQSTRGIQSPLQSPDPSGGADAMAVDEPYARPASSGHRQSHSTTPTIGTPIRLAPSTSAYRKPGAQKPGDVRHAPSQSTPQAVGTPAGTPTKGIMGQFSDLVFGW